jgi:chromosome segregation ATPase
MEAEIAALGGRLSALRALNEEIAESCATVSRQAAELAAVSEQSGEAAARRQQLLADLTASRDRRAALFAKRDALELSGDDNEYTIKPQRRDAETIEKEIASRRDGIEAKRHQIIAIIEDYFRSADAFAENAALVAEIDGQIDALLKADASSAGKRKRQS